MSDTVLCYAELGNAIFRQAVLDYYDACLLNITRKKRELKEFFKSDYCKMLTSLEPEEIMHKVEKLYASQQDLVA